MKHCKWIWFGALLALVMLATTPAQAVTDYVFLSVNGDTTNNVAVQGDSIGWGANCEIGATIAWQIWYDADSNETTGDAGDRILLSFATTDGDTIGEGGPFDVNPIPDGWYLSPPMILGFAPGHYVFVGTDMSDNTSAEKAFSVTPMASPVNMFTGTVTIEGVTAPDPLLSNIYIQAETEDMGFQLWSALTDEDGYYEIGMTDDATGLPFRISPEVLPGYATPPAQYLSASGQIDNVDFAYLTPVDSVYGDVMDENDDPIMMAYVWCSPQGGGDEKEYTVTDGSYIIYFGPGELGAWWLGISSDFLVPDYMVPQNISFDNSTVHGFRHDFVCQSTDTVIYVRVTEEGGPPTHQYLVMANSDVLASFTEGVSGVGAANEVVLHVSSIDDTYMVDLSRWDNRYPIPDGYVVQGSGLDAVAPGDTVTINLTMGFMVQDTIKVLPPDNVINWMQVSVNFSGPGGNINVNPDNNGVYTVYVGPGTYNVNVWHNSFLPLPQSRTVEVTGDTVGGMGFTLNYTHCHVTGHITGLPLPLDTNRYVNGMSGFWPNSYNVSGKVDAATGAFGFYVCDGSWEFSAPYIPNTYMPSPVFINIGGLDPTFDFDFNYEPMFLVSDTLTVDPGDTPLIWGNVYIQLTGSGGDYYTNPDDNGVWTMYVDTGVYDLTASIWGYLTDPAARNVHITGDTVGGMDFVLNQADVHVRGHLLGIPLPLPFGTHNVIGETETYPAGYHVLSEAVILSTGEYHLWACNGAWTFSPPDIPGYETPLPRYMELGETDTLAGYDFSYLVSAVDDPEASAIPREFSLSQNSPNPFNPATTIEYSLPEQSRVVIEVFNLLGERIRQLVNETRSAGIYQVTWDGVDQTGRVVSTGIYLYRFVAGNHIETKKMLLMK